MKKSKFDWSAFFVKALYCLGGLVVAGIIATTIYCLITYGGKPIQEIPGWALWFMFGGRR